MRKRSIAIVGAGMGGLAAAATLRQIGIDVQVYEQASRFARVGAGIQMMPNSMKVLRGIGVEARLRETFRAVLASQSHRRHRRGHARIADAGEPLRRALSLHAPRRTARRAAVDGSGEIVHLGKKLTGLEQAVDGVTLSFADGTQAQADAVIGADGVHSMVRDILVGPDAPFTKAESPIGPCFRQR